MNKQKLEVIGELVATLRGEEQQQILTEALKNHSWEEISEAVQDYNNK